MIPQLWYDISYNPLISEMVAPLIIIIGNWVSIWIYSILRKD